ncbi:MAG: hypothetical protein QOH25_1475 [Acidobacteriota bacterium]|jgi:hypothetical protein|nr:hypothetical protein [Acidobacteriota bacterium]
MDNLRFIFEVVVASGGAAVIVSAVFAFLGKQWIENRFAQRLKAYERKQNQELEHYKYQINSLFNRITKIHEREIEVLPAAWQKLQETHGHLARLIQPFRIEREFSQMNEGQFKEWQDEYNEISEHFMGFHNYLLYNSIFLSPDLYVEFKEVDKIFNEALDKSRIAKQGLNSSEFTLEVYENIYKKTEPIKEKIRELVQKRLRYEDAD